VSTPSARRVLHGVGPRRAGGHLHDPGRALDGAYLTDAASAWERLADGYDRRVTPLSRQVAEQVLGFLPLRRGQRLLDVACGSGALALPAAQRGAAVTAVDAAPTMIDRLVRRAREEGLSGLEGRVMDARALALGDAVFDVVASLDGILPLGDADEVVREIARVVRPGGRLLLAALGPEPEVEFRSYVEAALQAVAPVARPATPAPLSSKVPDCRVLHRYLAAVGCRDVRTSSLTWRIEVRSAAHLWDVATSSDPVLAARAAGLTATQRTTVHEVLDGMLRERSGGAPAAVLTAPVHVATGTR
jgi:ubiquinone/menaquinone biosynthesis C-methylase UbiE